MAILEAEVHSDGGEVALLELVIREPSEERALADRAVTDDDDFEKVVVLSDHVIILTE